MLPFYHNIDQYLCKVESCLSVKLIAGLITPGVIVVFCCCFFPFTMSFLSLCLDMLKFYRSLVGGHVIDIDVHHICAMGLSRGGF